MGFLQVSLVATLAYSYSSVNQTVVRMSYKGINVGAVLDTAKEGSKSHALQEFFFDDYATQGFSYVRMPVCFTSNMIGDILSDQFLARLVQVTDWCLGRGLICILAMHHDSQCPIASVEQMMSLWGQVSSKFVNRTNKLVFEILDDGSTDALNVAGVTAVRSASATRIVSISTDMNIPAALSTDSYLMGSFKYFKPQLYGGEDLTWGNATEKAQMANDLAREQAWAASNSVPVYCSAFGAPLAYDRASQLLWLSEFHKQSWQARQISSALWDTGSDFPVYGRCGKNSRDGQETLTISKQAWDTQVLVHLQLDNVSTATGVTSLNAGMECKSRYCFGFSACDKVSKTFGAPAALVFFMMIAITCIMATGAGFKLRRKHQHDKHEQIEEDKRIHNAMNEKAQKKKETQNAKLLSKVKTKSNHIV